MTDLQRHQYLLGTSRKELDGELTILSGEIPEGLTGAFFAMYQAGSVNSDGLPFPEHNEDGSKNREYGSPIMNGDGMCVAVYFEGPKARVKTRLMKTPCYYADEASKVGSKHHALFGFKNFGITRMSLALGSRNLLNTAPIPVKFKYQNHPGLMMTYDVGRPFSVNPKTLNLISPLGKNKEWLNAQPAMVPWPFGVVQTTAHPMFDPSKGEFFTVNYIRESSSNVLHEQTLKHITASKTTFREKLERLAKELFNHDNMEHVKEKVEHFFNNLEVELTGKGSKTNPVSGESEVYLWRWDGENTPMKWLIQDEEGNPLIIKECMHQTGMTEHYIVLTDCSFKFSIDLLMNNPFPENDNIDRFMRWLLSYPMVPSTTTYLVRRSDLRSDTGTVRAIKVKKDIPVETIHYSCNYSDEDDIITLYGLHNAAVCMAEWIRAYDINKIDSKPVDPQVISLFAIGSMDLSRMGKWVIDAKNGELKEDLCDELYSAGNYKEDKLGPNTWSLSLYTHRGLADAVEVNMSIRYIWFVAAGTDKRMLTEFIFNLYEKYPNRVFTVEELLDATSRDLPFTLNRLDTKSWKVDQVYQAEKLVYLRSIQFIPHTPARDHIEKDEDGFIMFTVQIGNVEADESVHYRTEFWVFDAMDIEKGPILKMMHPEVLICFSLHSAWLSEAVPTEWRYHVNVIDDYNEVIDAFPNVDKQAVKAFFYENVYPHFLPNLLHVK